MSYGDGPGIESEQLIRELITKSGWRIVETRKASDDGKAPMLRSDGGAVRLPDFQAVRPDPGPQYVEVKSKGEAIEFGVENSVRHGYERPKHHDYIEMAEASNTPVWLFVHERNTGVVLRQRIRSMNTVGSVTDEDTLRQAFNTTEPMVFFERDTFEVVTDDISQFATGFGQAGLLQPQIDLNPFGYQPDGDQGTLDRWGDGDE